MTPEFYAERRRNYNEILPWDIIDPGISKLYLMTEDQLATTTGDCRDTCNGCGMNKYTECTNMGINRRKEEQ